MATSDQNHSASDGKAERETKDDGQLTNEQHVPVADNGTAGTGDALHLVVDGVAGDSTSPVNDCHLADNDLVAAIAATSPDTLASIEHTLDQLTTATDLFDVPAVDFDTGAGS
jgi:hypothetical protein